MKNIVKLCFKGLFPTILIGFLLTPLAQASDITDSQTIDEIPATVESAEDVAEELHDETSTEADHTKTTGQADEEHSGGHGEFGPIFLFLAILLLSAKVGGVIEKAGQPAVLGELLAGIGLSILAFVGVPMIDDIRTNETVAFLAEIGAVILLFQIGLESNIKQLMKVGLSAFLVALVGVIVPFTTGTFLLGPLFFPDGTFIAHLFLGASLVATSVGITASVFKSLKILKTQSAQTVLGAAVIDDVLGLLVLAIVSALATGGEVTPMFIARLSFEAFAFLGGAILLGTFLAKPISTFFSKIHTGSGMKLAIALTFALVFAYLATLVGLAPIVGAFAAGLVLDAVHFNSFSGPSIASRLAKLSSNLKSGEKATKAELEKVIHKVGHTHIEDMIDNVALVFVPMFFAFTGLQIEIGSLLDPSIYLIAIVAGLVAVLSKVIAGIFAKGSFLEKLTVGMSMVPRGEVGLIFASIGRSLGAINAQEFSVIVLVVIITTFVSPPLIKILAQKLKAEQKAQKLSLNKAVA